MNSKPAREFLRANRRSNTDLYPDDWKKLPIPDIPPEQQAPVVALVEKILAARRADPGADITPFETELDALVAGLYGLSSAASPVPTSRTKQTDTHPIRRGQTKKVRPM